MSVSGVPVGVVVLFVEPAALPFPWVRRSVWVHGSVLTRRGPVARVAVLRGLFMVGSEMVLGTAGTSGFGSGSHGAGVSCDFPLGESFSVTPCVQGESLPVVPVFRYIHC